MKKTRKVFGVLLAIFGVILSIIIALVFAVVLHDRGEYGTAIGTIWVYPLLFLAGISIILLGIRLFRKPTVTKDRKAETASDSIQTAEYKTFRSSPKEQFKVFCFVAFVPIVFTVLLIVVSNLHSFETARSIIAPVLYVLLPVSLLAALIISCYTYRIRVEIGDFGIRFYRGGHMYASYPLDSGFHIAKDTENMRRIYTTYAISIGLENQKKKRQVFFGFNRRDFWAAWAELRSLLYETQTAKEEYQSVHMPQSFTIPKADIKAAMRRKIPQVFSVVFVLGELLVILWTGLIYLLNKEALGAQPVYIGMAAVVVIAGIFSTIGALRNKRISDFIPEEITFGEGWLSVGDNRYYASQIKQIEFTMGLYLPQNIGKPFYRCLLIDACGKTDLYLLGHKAPAKYQVYQDYALLISALYAWAEGSEIRFSGITNPCVSLNTINKNCTDRLSGERAI